MKQASHKKSKLCKVETCCREIRIQAGLMKKGQLYYGLNTLTDSNEIWKCLHVKKNPNKNIVQRIYTS